MPNLVRVKDPVSGHEYDVPKSRLAVCPDLVVLDKPTGQRTKPRLPLGTPLPGGKVERRRAAEKKATAKKTAAKKSTAKKPPAANPSSADRNDGQSVATEKEN